MASVSIFVTPGNELSACFTLAQQPLQVMPGMVNLTREAVASGRAIPVSPVVIGVSSPVVATGVESFVPPQPVTARARTRMESILMALKPFRGK